MFFKTLPLILVLSLFAHAGRQKADRKLLHLNIKEARTNTQLIKDLKIENSATIALLKEAIHSKKPNKSVDLMKVFLELNKGEKFDLTKKKGTLSDLLVKDQATIIVDEFSSKANSKLKEAVINGDLEGTIKALEMGADVNSNSVLYKASHKGYKKIVQILLIKGANPNVNALSIASTMGYLEIVKSLLEYEVIIDDTDWDRRTALHHASRKGHADIVRLLLEKGADPRAEDWDDDTPLSIAYNDKIENIIMAHMLEIEEGR